MSKKRPGLLGVKAFEATGKLLGFSPFFLGFKGRVLILGAL